MTTTNLTRRTALAGAAAVSLAAVLPPVAVAESAAPTSAAFYSAGRERLVALIGDKPGEKLLAAWDRLTRAELAYDCDAEDPDPAARAEHEAALDEWFWRASQTNLSLNYIHSGQGEPFDRGDEQTLDFCLNIQACPDSEREALMGALIVGMERMRANPGMSEAEYKRVFSAALRDTGIPRLIERADAIEREAA